MAPLIKKEKSDSGTLVAASSHRNLRISGDVGVMWIPGIEQGTPYVGINYDLFLYNDKQPLGIQAPYVQHQGLMRGYCPCGWGLLRRSSVVIGATATSIGDGDSTINDLIGSYSVITGLAFRFTQSSRLGIGAVHFLREHPNPLVDEREWAKAVYLSYSYSGNVDTKAQDLIKFVAGIGTVITSLTQ